MRCRRSSRCSSRSYPITPASDILHELSQHKNFGVRTIQAEDEIAAAGMAVGAAFAGHIGVTATSGPGLDLKSETIGLAFPLELPMIIVDVQRAGPSTGLPTKTEQSDLMLAMYGRHGEAPLPIVAAYSPASCFWAAIEAVRIAIKYMTPVILLSDTYLRTRPSRGSCPTSTTSPTSRRVRDAAEPGRRVLAVPARREPRAAVGDPRNAGLEHRVGGLEKPDGTGNISYDPDNHEYMTRIRAAKVAKIDDDIPDLDGGRGRRRGAPRDRVGLHLRRDPRGRERACATEARRSPRRT